MNYFYCCYTRSVLHSRSLVGLLTVALACVGVEANAGFVDGSYNIVIGESTRLLEAGLQKERGEISQLQFNAIELEEACKNPSARLHDRNRFGLLIENTSDAENELRSFTIDLEELGFEFGFGDLPGDGFNGSLVLQSDRSDAGVNVSASYATNGNDVDPTKLVLNFSGLTKDRASIFRLDLDPVPVVNAFYPDYRGIVLGADVGLGPTAPALVSATFGIGDMETSTATRAFNSDVDPVFASGQLENYHAQSPSDMFEHGDGTVPEPSGLVLLLAGLSGMLALRRGR